ncbi:nickel transporter [Candidatus Pantoea alvi]|uniref:nickel/cobalt transporter n=1 Tax=Enterobacter agglomerans TaxID=549 RepID=UPI000CDD4F76|nr:nickel/cobalt transporter [Pantoea agglomerans]POW59998.1 nickel transporter [Pantoea alvi]UBN55364.1 nickel/cobalt transporter [Pantoea agglomerans]
MSLMPSYLRARRAWPLWLLAAALAAGAFALWQFWPQILLQSTIWQRGLHQQMTQLLQQVKTAPGQAGGLLVLFSLAYGVLHALGPGHGKVVIATFLATHPTRLTVTLRLTLLASLLQGCVAILLVTLMLVVLQTSSRQLHLSSYWLEKGSYLLVIGLGIWIGVRAIKALRRQLRPRSPMKIHALRAEHQHDAHCGCGHAHMPDAQQVAGAVSVKTQLLLVASMGLRPCSGAIMMLLFSRVIGVYLWGVLSAAVMALGTALTISAIGLLVQRSRALAQRLGSESRAASAAALVTPLLALLCSMLLIAAGLALWQSAAPGIGGGLRPFG